MFLINPDENKCLMALEKMTTSLEGIECSPIQVISLKDYTLAWSHCKQYENLHKFKNAYYIGKLKFTEQACETLIIHDTSLKIEDIPPLTNGTIIYFSEDQIVVEPLNVTNIFYSIDSVSDMQLLIADAEGYMPSHEGVATLSAVGYFPGNITLFSEIKKIPFLFTLDLQNHLVTQRQKVQCHKSNDMLLIKRLQKITPNHPKQYLGMTGGKDCRFVLGILNSVGIKPTIVHVTTGETGIVEDLAGSLNCQLIKVPSSTASLSPKIYTLATDAQIYASGSVLSNIIPYLSKDSLFHTGIFADLLLKDTFKTAVKVPGFRRKVYDKCIRMLLTSASELHNDLCYFNTQNDLFDYLKKELNFGNEYSKYSTKKEWANWFYYLHRGIRWGNAVSMDLSYYINVVFLMSDLEAVSYAISSRMWDNFAYERAVKLNEIILPTVKTPFAVQINLSKNRAIKAIQKIEFEYFHRFIVMKRDKKAFLSKSKREYKLQGIDLIEPRSYKKYYCKNLNDLIKSDSSYSLKRAAVTITYVLNYLEK